MFEHLLSFMKHKTPATKPARRRTLRLETLEARVVLDATILSPLPAPPPSPTIDTARVVAPAATVLQPVDQQQSPTHSLPTSASANNGAVWATVTSNYVAPASGLPGTMDVYLDIHLGNLNGKTPTGSVNGVPLVQGEVFVHGQTTGGANGDTWQSSLDQVFAYSGDRNFTPAAWGMISLSNSSADHPTLFLKLILPPNPSPVSTDNGAVWATTTSTYVAPTGDASGTGGTAGTMDLYVDLHLTNLNGLMPTGTIDGVPLLNGEAILHYQTTGGANGADWTSSPDFRLTYSGDRNFATATWLLSDLTVSSADRPTRFLTLNHAVPSVAISSIGTDAPNAPPVSATPAKVALAGTSSPPLAPVGDATTGPTGASGPGSSSSSVPPTAVTSSATGGGVATPPTGASGPGPSSAPQTGVTPSATGGGVATPPTGVSGPGSSSSSVLPTAATSSATGGDVATPPTGASGPGSSSAPQTGVTPSATGGGVAAGSTEASGPGSSSSSVPPTGVTSNLPDPTQEVVDTAIFGNLGQDFWLSLRSVAR